MSGQNSAYANSDEPVHRKFPHSCCQEDTASFLLISKNLFDSHSSDIMYYAHLCQKSLKQSLSENLKHFEAKITQENC